MGEVMATGTAAMVPAGPVSERTREYLAASKAPRTVRAYRSDLADFESWCREQGRAPLPADPATVADYIAAQAAQGRSAATITRRLSAISQAHRMAGYESPTHAQLVRSTAAGIRRTIGTAPRQARPVMVDDLRAMLAALPDDLHGLRDRALLLVGFAAGMRRSELVALDVADVAEEADGLRVTIRRSKTDQEGAGREVGIVRGRVPLTDPVSAVREWREAAGITDGALFRSVDRHGTVGERLSDKGVARIVRGSAVRAGLDPERFSGHSLRAGLATSAAAAGAPETAIMRTTGHQSTAMVRRYIRAGNLFTESASRFLLAL